MKTLTFLFLLTVFIQFLSRNYCCICPADSNSFSAVSTSTRDLSLSLDNEVIKNIDYGRLIYMNKMVFLTNDVNISSSTGALSNQCPAGYRPPTIEEYSAILNVYNNKTFQILTGNANYSTLYSYMTSNKTYPNITNGGDNNAWVYQCLILDKVNNKSKVDNCNTYWSKATQKVKCVLDMKVNRTIQLTGMPTQDFLPRQNYTLIVNNTNVLSYSWNFINEKFTSSNRNITYKPTSDGCKTLVLKVTLFGGIGLSNCLPYFVTSPYPNAPSKTEFYELSPEEEKIGGFNYGRLITLNGSIWLTQDVTTGATTGNTIPNQCPINFRPAVLDELQRVLNNLGPYGYYILTRAANYSTNFNYMTNTKTYPNQTGDNAYLFKGLSLSNVTLTTSIKDLHTYWESQKSRIKCLRIGVDNIFSIKGEPVSDLYVGQNYTFEIIQTNSITYRWDVGDGKVSLNRSVVFSSKTTGRKVVCANVTVFGNLKKGRCFEFYVQPADGSINSGGAVELSSEEEIYDGISYGRLVRLGGLVWLQNDSKVSRSNGILSQSCPLGYEPPTQKLYDALVSSLGDDAFYTLTRQANYNITYNYMTANLTNTTGDQAVFNGIHLYENPNRITPVSINTYWSFDSCRVKCLLRNASLLNVFIKGLPANDLEVGLRYQWEVVQSNALSFKWDLGNGTISKNKTILFAAFKEETRKVCVTVNVNGWFNKSRCFEFNVKKTLTPSTDPSTVVTFSNDVLVSQEDEIIYGVNYGKMIKIGNSLWLSKDVPVGKSIGSLSYTCPAGYRAPTMDEYVNLIGVLGVNASQILKQVGLNQSLYYLTTTKSFYRVGANGGDGNDWIFKGLQFNGNTVRVSDISTYWSTAQSFVRCILNSFNIPFEITGLPIQDLYLGTNYSLQLATTNGISYKWEIGSSVFTQKAINFSAQTLGKNKFCITMQIFAGFIKSYCQNIFVILQYNKNVNTVLTQAQYHNATIQNFKINAVNGLHFSGASAPLAPNDNGNSYVLFSQKISNSLISIELDPNGVIINGSLCNLTIKARPLDVVSTPWGFAAYIRYDNLSKASVIGVFKNCSVKFERNVMNNENGAGSPTIAKDQLMYYDANSSDSQPFGMAVMFNPHNGRLAYARERLALIFAHYNHFGVRDDGTANDHTGSTFVSFDQETAKDDKLGFSWGCSHSLNQANVWDGDKFITASLGDAYPMGIVVTKCEGVLSNGWVEPFTGKANRLDCTGSSSLVNGTIPGDGWGDAAGRLGGLLVLNETDYVLVYSRKTANVTFQNTPPAIVNTQHEIALSFFNKSYGVKKTVVIADGQTNNLLHTARYGNRILVGYSLSTCLNGAYVCASYSNTDKFYLRLVDYDGNNLGEISVNTLPASDDFEILVDGRIAWTSFGNDGSLYYHYLSPPGK